MEHSMIFLNFRFKYTIHMFPLPYHRTAFPEA